MLWVFLYSYFLPPSHIPLEELVDCGCDGHSQQHAHYAVQPAADGDGGQHPDPRKAYGRAYHSGVDQVAFQLLQDHDEDQEAQSLDGIDGGDHEGAYESAQVCAHNRQQRGGADQGSDHAGVGEPEDGHADGTQGAQDHRFRTLADDKPGKCIVGGGDHHIQPVIPFLLQVGLGQCLELVEQPFPAGQDVDGEDHCHDEVYDQGADAAQDIHGR